MPKLITLLLCLMTLCLLGCGDSSRTPSSNQSETAEKDRPPLRVLLVDFPELKSEIDLRWQTVSEQPLSIQLLSRGEFENWKPEPFDVVLYPASLTGTLFTSDLIAPLPTRVLKQTTESAEPTSSSADSAGTSKNAISTFLNAWPTRWRQSATYGGALASMPLGAPNLVAITLDLKQSSIQELHASMASNLAPEQGCLSFWESYLDQAEQSLQATSDERKARWSAILEKGLSPEQRRWVRQRYLWLLSTIEVRHRGLFDLYQAKSRLNQPEFERALKVFHRIACLAPDQMVASPVDAWETVAEGKAAFAIGWPKTDGTEREQNAAISKRIHILPIAWNSGDGLVVSIGRRTRQSAVSTRFISWLSEPDQRRALQSRTPLVELNEISDDKNVIREDYREYQSIQVNESSNVALAVTTCFNHADAYFEKLELALEAALKQPANAGEVLRKCKEDWDALTEHYGEPKQKLSFERASGRGY